MLVVGGLGSVSGAVVGAVAVTAVFEVMRRVEERIEVPGTTQIVVALLILLVLYRRPNGLMGLSEADDLLARRFSALRGRRGSPAPPALNASGNSHRHAWPPGTSTQVESGSSSCRRRESFG